MASEFTVTPSIGAVFWHQDYWKTVAEEVHLSAQSLIDTMVPLVQDKITHLDTGALSENIMGSFDPNPNQDEIAIIFPSEQAQMDAHGRIYAQYIEGGPLGDTSWTIRSPDEMFQRTAEEDLATVEAWASAVAQNALDRIARGEGVV